MDDQRRRWVQRVLVTLIWIFALAAAYKLAASAYQVGVVLWGRIHATERADPEARTEHDIIDREHVARYRFAKQFCAGKTVADIASGTGFGTKILREVAKSVDGYDREALGQEYLIDLEKQGWDKHYDVIVSFETIEHLANPEFFLGNIKKTANMLLLSTPLDEHKGLALNPYHKQVWTNESIKKLLDKFFTCEYYYQWGERIEKPEFQPRYIIIAVCTNPSGN